MLTHKDAFNTLRTIITSHKINFYVSNFHHHKMLYKRFKIKVKIFHNNSNKNHCFFYLYFMLILFISYNKKFSWHRFLSCRSQFYLLKNVEHEERLKEIYLSHYRNTRNYCVFSHFSLQFFSQFITAKYNSFNTYHIYA